MPHRKKCASLSGGGLTHLAVRRVACVQPQGRPWQRPGRGRASLDVLPGTWDTEAELRHSPRSHIRVFVATYGGAPGIHPYPGGQCRLLAPPAWTSGTQHSDTSENTSLACEFTRILSLAAGAPGARDHQWLAQRSRGHPGSAARPWSAAETLPQSPGRLRERGLGGGRVKSCVTPPEAVVGRIARLPEPLWSIGAPGPIISCPPVRVALVSTPASRLQYSNGRCPGTRRRVTARQRFRISLAP